MEYLLTIAIPTYNREKIINSNVEFLRNNLKTKYADIIEVLVIDNHSEDNTYNRLLKMTDNIKNYQVHQNKENIGYAKNFLRLFTKARGKYLLVTSDEDFINTKIIDELILFLKEKSPNVVFSGTNKFYHRGCERLKKLDIPELNRSAYVSGGVYNKYLALKYIKYLQEMIDTNVFLQLYPQIILTKLIYLEDNGMDSYIFPGYIVEQKFEEKTLITSEGESYALVEKRLEQYLYYKQLLDKLKMDNIISDRNHHKLHLIEARALRKRIVVSIRNTSIEFHSVVGTSLFSYYKKILKDFFYDTIQHVKYKLFKCKL